MNKFSEMFENIGVGIAATVLMFFIVAVILACVIVALLAIKWLWWLLML